MGTSTPLAVSVSRVIPAPADALYDLITDVAQMGRFSPETVSARWIDGAQSAVVGAKFKGKNVVGPNRWSTKPVVTVAERGTCFAFQVPGRAGPLWTYRFESIDGSTLVTESMRQQRRSPLMIRMLLRLAGVTDRADHLRLGMTETLDRLAHTAAETVPA